jgi:hypothetical protein
LQHTPNINKLIDEIKTSSSHSVRLSSKTDSALNLLNSNLTQQDEKAQFNDDLTKSSRQYHLKNNKINFTEESLSQIESIPQDASCLKELQQYLIGSN